MLLPPRRSANPAPYDVVRLREPVPEHGLESGDEGTVVEVFAEPEGFLVDFSCEPGFDGDPLPVYSLTADQIEVVPRLRGRPPRQS
jgi:hypothetical protein